MRPPCTITITIRQTHAATIAIHLHATTSQFNTEKTHHLNAWLQPRLFVSERRGNKAARSLNHIWPLATILAATAAATPPSGELAIILVAINGQKSRSRTLLWLLPLVMQVEMAHLHCHSCLLQLEVPCFRVVAWRHYIYIQSPFLPFLYSYIHLLLAIIIIIIAIVIISSSSEDGSISIHEIKKKSEIVLAYHRHYHHHHATVGLGVTIP